MSRIFLITGAGHFPGIGSSTAMLMLERKDCVVVNSRSFDQKWQDLIQQYPGQVILVSGDITDDRVRREIVSQAIGTWGRIDGLVNNAGTGIPTYQEDGLLTDSAWAENFEVNVTAPYYLAELCREHLKASNGSIVNVSTRSALQPGVGNNLAYAVSKAALNHLTKNQAMSFAREVNVNAICPGMVPSGRLQAILENYDAKVKKYRDNNLTGELVSCESCAKGILYLIDAKDVTGQLLPIDAGGSIIPFMTSLFNT